jgi:hypothetical protein
MYLNWYILSTVDSGHYISKYSPLQHQSQKLSGFIASALPFMQRLGFIIHKLVFNYDELSIFAVLNSVEIYRNGIFLGGRQPENKQKYYVRHMH